VRHQLYLKVEKHSRIYKKQQQQSLLSSGSCSHTT